MNDQILTKFIFMSKDPFESKCQLFINGREKVGNKILENPKALIHY